jgi:bacteriocin-like protein
MEFKDLTPEQIEKAKSVSSPDELLALAKEEGIELTNEDLAQVSGGKSWGGNGGVRKCPKCGKDDFTLAYTDQGEDYYRCDNCGTIIKA